MHICFNALDYPSAIGGGGVGTQVQLLGRALVEAGHRVTVIDLAQKGLADETEDHGVRVCRVRCGNWHWYLSKLPGVGRLFVLTVREIERSWAVWRRIRAIHQSDPIDIVEGTETAMLLLAYHRSLLPSVIRLHGEPYTFVKHTPDLPLTLDLRWTRFLQRWALRRARLLISPSYRHAREIREELGKSAPPLEVVPNVISEDLLRVGSESTADTACSLVDVVGPIVLFVGRLERGKGVPLLLQAASRVLAEVLDVHFVLVGGRQANLAEKDLNDLLKQLPDPKRVHLLGHVPWDRLLGWYRRAALCVLPSYYETFGLAVLEPMAFGLPVVALSAGALPELVQNQVTGLLAPPGDSAALAAAITHLVKDPDLRRRLGENGRRAAQRFLVANHLRDNLELLRWAARRDPRIPEGETEHVFFAPHLDDTILSCGGLIHAAVGRGKKARAVTVFAGVDKRQPPSAFARHLHEKWGLRDSPADRLQEDQRAFRRLGVVAVEHWEFLEAPYRHDESGAPLYCTYDELKGEPSAADGFLVEALVQRVRQSTPGADSARRLYFPLGLGGHVDHRLLFQVGLRLRSESWDVRFYEDWPYAEVYEPAHTSLGWLSERVDVSLADKHAAILEYRSQLPGLGGSASVLQARLARYAFRVGGGRAQERYWFVTPSRAARLIEMTEGSQNGPFRPKPQPDGRRGVRRILSLVRGIQLAHLLPRGSGECLHLDGAEDERAVIEAQGYHCRSIASAELRESIAPSSAAALVAWRPRELSAVEQLIRDASALLEAGGVLVGRLSGNEATRLMESLRRHGFRDIALVPTRSVGTHVRTLRVPSRANTSRDAERRTRAFPRSAWERGIAFMARKAAVEVQCTSDF
ncbi:MAG: glycosyltransferase [Gemmataceae bacterium]